MRKLSILAILAVAAFIAGCGSGSTAENGTTSNTAGASTPTQPANREGDVTGQWTLDIDATKFEPTAETQKQLDKQPLGAGAVPALEKQMKEQLKTQLGDGVWTFSADKTVEIKSKADNAKGTWTISGNEITMKTDKAPESKMTLSEDGKRLVMKVVQEAGTLTLELKKS